MDCSKNIHFSGALICFACTFHGKQGKLSFQKAREGSFLQGLAFLYQREGQGKARILAFPHRLYLRPLNDFGQLPDFWRNFGISSQI